MRIESAEQIELGNIMELLIAGQVLRWARQSNLSGGVSLRKADGWNVKNHSHLAVARQFREKVHPSVLVVTIREGEEKRKVQCSDERATEYHQRSGWKRMRSCNVAEQKVNNLEKTDCENLAEEETDEIHRR